MLLLLTIWRFFVGNNNITNQLFRLVPGSIQEDWRSKTMHAATHVSPAGVSFANDKSDATEQRSLKHIPYALQPPPESETGNYNKWCHCRVCSWGLTAVIIMDKKTHFGYHLMQTTTLLHTWRWLLRAMRIFCPHMSVISITSTKTFAGGVHLKCGNTTKWNNSTVK